jgi:hypothetical protein
LAAVASAFASIAGADDRVESRSNFSDPLRIDVTCAVTAGATTTIAPIANAERSSWRLVIKDGTCRYELDTSRAVKCAVGTTTAKP